MRKKFFSCFVLCIIIVLSYLYAHIDKNDYVYNKGTDASVFVGTGVVLDGEAITQTFLAKENTIDGINLKIAVYGSSENLVLQYDVLDSTNAIVAEGEISGKELQHNKFNHLQLPTIKNTQGKQYTLVLNVRHADEQNGLEFFVEPGLKENQKLTVRGQETEGVLVTRITSHGFNMETFVVLLGVIAFIIGFIKILYKFFR